MAMLVYWSVLIFDHRNYNKQQRLTPLLLVVCRGSSVASKTLSRFKSVNAYKTWYSWSLIRFGPVWIAIWWTHPDPECQWIIWGKPSLKLTASSPLQIWFPKRKFIFQPSIFRCYVSFREGIQFSVDVVFPSRHPNTIDLEMFDGFCFSTRHPVIPPDDSG